MQYTHKIAILIGLFFVAALAGCSGGGGSNGSNLNGSITGQVSPASLTSAGGTVTATIDGKNISAPVAPDGSFSLPNVPPGVYTLVLKSPGHAGDVVVQVAAGGVTDVGAVDLTAAGQISGLVTDQSTGAPIVNATVTVAESSTVSATADQPPLPVRGAITNPGGSYVIDGLPVGSYLVTISCQGYITGTLQVNVTAGTTTTGDIRLAPVSASNSGTLTGVVSAMNSDGTQSPLSGVFVILSSQGGSPGGPPLPVPPTATGPTGQPVILWPGGPGGQSYYAYTGDNGSYTITGIAPGTYTATAVRPGFQTATQTVTVTQGQSTSLNFTLAIYQIPTGTVTGKVTDAATGAAIAGAKVVAIINAPMPLAAGARKPHSAVALPTQPATFDLSTVTDPSGNYTLVVPTSTYQIFCAANGYASADEQVAVSEGATVTLNIALSSGSSLQATISGTVREAATGLPPGAGTPAVVPVAGATVTITTSPLLIPGPGETSGGAVGSGGSGSGSVGPPTVVYTATTDANGQYSTTIPIGVYEVTASKGNDSSGPSYVRLVSDRTVDLILVPPTIPPPPPTPNVRK